MKLQRAQDLNTSRVDLLDLDDACLVERALDDDYRAFEALVMRYEEQFHRLAWSYVKSDSDAEDVVQNAFLKIYRKLDTFRGDARFKNWAYRVVINTALSRLRKRSTRGEVALEDVNPNFEEDEELATTSIQQWKVRADEAAENTELRKLIVDAVDKLEEKYETVFLLYEVEGLSMEEIADVIDLTIGGVKTRLHRARLHLRATLERHVEFDA
ncbi:MAG: RNA polymerase sigma factor [Myxococcota bacterium]